MVTLPHVEAGDSVWWHPDLLHCVESAHLGREPNVVIYIPCGPDCPVNRLYVERSRMLFRRGLGPPDFNGKPDNELHFR